MVCSVGKQMFPAGPLLFPEWLSRCVNARAMGIPLLAAKSPDSSGEVECGTLGREGGNPVRELLLVTAHSEGEERVGSRSSPSSVLQEDDGG